MSSPEAQTTEDYVGFDPGQWYQATGAHEDVAYHAGVALFADIGRMNPKNIAGLDEGQWDAVSRARDRALDTSLPPEDAKVITRIMGQTMLDDLMS